MDGKNSLKVEEIARHLARNTLKNYQEPVDLPGFLLGDLTPNQFVTKNASGRGTTSYAHFFIAMSFLGEKDRGKALHHLDACIEADSLFPMQGWALGIHNMLKTNDPTLEWIR